MTLLASAAAAYLHAQHSDLFHDQLKVLKPDAEDAGCHRDEIWPGRPSNLAQEDEAVQSSRGYEKALKERYHRWVYYQSR